MDPSQLLPVELWQQVFCYACVDDGTTGRSLSLVCRHFNRLSKEIKLQSLSIVGFDEIVKAYEMLERLPEKHRRIQHLFLSSELCHARHRNDGESQQRSYMYEIDRQKYDEACEAYRRLLKLIAPSLKSLYLVAQRLGRLSLFVPISLPSLTDLTVVGPFPVHNPEMYQASLSTRFENLRRLRCLGFSNYPANFFGLVSQQAPCLTRLCLQPTQSVRHLAGDLQNALLEMPGHPHDSPDDKLPSSIENVCIQPGPAPAGGGAIGNKLYQHSLQGLQALAGRDPRLIISRTCRIISTADDAEAEWLESWHSRLQIRN